jgi:phage-related protein
MIDEAPLKPVIWVGSSRVDIRAFPELVQDHVGYASTSRSVAAGIATRGR